MVLFVDSDLNTLEENRRKLALKGIHALSATTIEEAAYIIESNPFVQAVVTDVFISGGNGFALIRWIKDHRPKIKRIILTDQLSEEDIVKELDDDDDQTLYIKKPIDIEEQLYMYLL